MAIEIISSEEVWSKSRQGNKYKRWPSRSNAERLSPIATPVAQTSFKIKPDEKIFCIGSCFANEISQALHRLDYNVLSIFHDLPASHEQSNDGIFHKYNVASIYNELAWALDPKKPYDHDLALVDANDDYLQDYQLSGQNRSYEPEFAKAFRDAFNLAFATIKQADVVILTLGLSEVWFDTHTQLYLNVAVPNKVAKRHPGRFELHVFDYDTTLSFINAIYDLLNTYLKSSFRLLITVSPVPLIYTFRQQDIFTANSYSKAVLRVAVEELVMNKENVNYFPSYEFVTLSNPSVVWRSDDFRHVDSSFVDYIMANVMAQFTDTSPTISEDNLVLKAKSLYYGNFISEAKQLLSSILKDQKKPNKEALLLLTTLRVGVNGKYKAWWLNASTYLKTYRHMNVWQHIRLGINGYRKISNKRYVGHVDKWDGHFIEGWACNIKRKKPIQVKVLVGGKVVSLVTVELPRSDVADIYGQEHLLTGFRIPLEVSEVNSSEIRVVYADTDLDLIDSPVYLDLKG